MANMTFKANLIPNSDLGYELGSSNPLKRWKIYGPVYTLGADIILNTASSSSDDSGDIIWYYGNGKEKARLWTDTNYTSAKGVNYRVYKKDGTLLTETTLSLATHNHDDTYVRRNGDIRISQYNQGTWTKFLTFTIQHEYTSSISFRWLPTECARDIWADFNINIRSGNIAFYANWHGTNIRTLKCVGDGSTFTVWVQGTKTSWDPYGLIQHVGHWGVTYSYGIAYQDAEPTGTYQKFCDTTGIVGNANSANKLSTARNINGTAFDGTANITTANWGTARTLTIGATGKSVNGSANVSWSKAEILGSSTNANFYRGDQTWASTLNNTLILVPPTTNMAASNMAFNGGIQVRESGGVGNAQSAIEYGPRISFHWGNRTAKSITLHSDGIFYFRDQNGTTRSTIDANLNGNATTATTATTLTSNAGSTTVPIYFSGGKPVQCSTTLGVNITGSANSALYSTSVVAHSTSGTGPDYGGWWYCIGTITITGRYGNGGCHINIRTSSDAGGISYSIDAIVRLKQQNALGEAPSYSIRVMQYDGIAPTQLRLIITTNTTTQVVGQLWCQIASTYQSHRVTFLDYENFNIVMGNLQASPPGGSYVTGVQVPIYGAVWNDYAEYRISTSKEPGRVVIEKGDDELILSTTRMQPGAEIISDTYGFAIGETDTAKTPIATSGRVLAYPYEDREEFKKAIGRPVCSGPNGTVSIMTDEEYTRFGYCAIGTVSAVPDYEEWGTGNVKVNGRIWIRIK